MSVYISDRTIEWRVLAAEPDVRLSAASDYARTIFDDDAEAAAWLQQVSPAVQDGRCTVAEACRTPDGFIEAICELVRMSMPAAGGTFSVPYPSAS